MRTINKVIHPLDIKISGYKTFCPVFMKIKYDPEGRLSISGVIGPYPSGNARGGCGQIDMEFQDSAYSKVKLTASMIITELKFNNDTYTNKEEIRFSPGWNVAKFKKLLEIWSNWHLNDMKAGCVHQRELGWDKELIDPALPATQENMKTWSYPPKDHLTEVTTPTRAARTSAWSRKPSSAA